MIKKLLPTILGACMMISCTTEKVSLSPSLNDFPGINTKKIVNLPANFKNKSSELFYASELSNLVSSFPTFSNTTLNKEVNKLKFYIKDYVYALQEYNVTGRENALNNIEKSYKKIQNLRRFLNTDDNEVINRYLVRIKSNISQLKAVSKSGDSINS